MEISKEQIDYIVKEAAKIGHGQIRLVAMANRKLADIIIERRERFDDK